MTAKIVNLIQAHQIQQLLMVAEPQILGMMRDVIAPLLGKNIKIHELAKEICHLKTHEIHEYLASKNLLPPHKRASI
ncbi:host attachment protein [Tolypothrix tenuis]